LAKLSGEPFIPNDVLKSGNCLGIWTVDNLVLISQEPIPELPG
jgi:hypothetical protein